MWILLIIGFIIPFVYLGYLMTRLDKYLVKNTSAIVEENGYPTAIVLGKNDLAEQMTERLEKNKIQVFHLAEPFLFKREGDFRYLFALSENDADNLVLCKIGKKLYCVENIISICNNQRNESIFVSEKVRYVPKGEASAQILYEAVLKETGVQSW